MKTWHRLILPEWAMNQGKPKVLEGFFTQKELQTHSHSGYGIYHLPNYPKTYPQGTVDGRHITEFEYVFMDMDLKDKVYETKDQFIEKLGESGLNPAKIIDSGNGIHVYLRVQNLEGMSYLRFQRRLARTFKTDDATTSLFQLLRTPGFMNTKNQTKPILCSQLYASDHVYGAEELDKLLPKISLEDEKACQAHYDRIHNPSQASVTDDSIPTKFGQLLLENEEVRQIFRSDVDDRSKGDYKLGWLLLSYNYTREEAIRVLMNSQKAEQRSPSHRLSYAQNIVDKVYTLTSPKQTSDLLSETVESILEGKSDEDLQGTRFKCYPFFDGTEHGFRLTQVIGLCAGVGVGKTAIGLNLFKGFVQNNPGYIHMFVSLEQPAREIAHRWKKLCGNNTTLHNKVHVISNYDADGVYRNLSFKQIQDYIIRFKQQTGFDIGCVCIDHIGVLRKERRAGQYEGLQEICAQMKSFAVATNSILVMQSQTTREKAGVGDIELFKDAAYGTQHFESYLDYLLVAWQPLKRCYDNLKCPRITAYKFAKVRSKSVKDRLIEDQCYRLLFDQETETLRHITQDEDKSFNFFANLALKLRKKDKNNDLVTYQPLQDTK